jgi:hypothetical protein
MISNARFRAEAAVSREKKQTGCDFDLFTKDKGQ